MKEKHGYTHIADAVAFLSQEDSCTSYFGIHANQSFWAASGRDGGRESYSRNPDVLSARGTALTATITSRPQCSHNTRTWPSGVDPCFDMVLL